MKNWRIVFRIFYIAGFLTIVGIFLFLEWESLRDDFSKIVNPLVHLGIILALLVKPLTWVSLGFMLVGHMCELILVKEE